MNTSRVIALIIIALGIAVIVAGTPILGVIIVAAAGYVGLFPASGHTERTVGNRGR